EVRPAVHDGESVALHQLLGHVAKGWGHVHFAERPRRGAAYVDPLRPGGLTPFVKHTHPLITKLTFEKGGSAIHSARVTGLVDVIAEAHDQTPLPVPPPWHGMPVSPMRLRCRILRVDLVVQPC